MNCRYCGNKLAKSGGAHCANTQCNWCKKCWVKIRAERGEASEPEPDATR